MFQDDITVILLIMTQLLTFLWRSHLNVYYLFSLVFPLYTNTILNIHMFIAL